MFYHVFKVKIVGLVGKIQQVIDENILSGRQ